MILHGKNLIVKADGIAIACSQSCEINIDVDTKETANPTSGIWKTYLAGRKGWMVSVGSLARVGTSKDNLRSFFDLPGKDITISFEVDDGFFYAWEGKAICTKSSIVGMIRNLAKGTFQFLGNGPLQDKHEEVPIRQILIDKNQPWDTGYYLRKQQSTGKITILFHYDEDTDTETILTPSEHVRYTNSGNTYRWNGEEFIKVN